MSYSLRRRTAPKILTLFLSAFLLSGCASLFDPKPKRPDPNEDETSRMERYVDCLRDDDRDIEDPPCLLK